MSKKIMALILAFAMVFSTITVAFAEEPVAEVGPEAAALAKIEVLKGVDGVTAEYLKEAPTRLQAAIMLLRLKGLEEEAMKYESEDNFEDVKDYAWAEGKNIMAYLKANPTVGYRGTGNGFEPNKPITAKEYYKVLLVTLGYVENTADVAGDFTWETVEDKLKEVGLGKVLDVEAYTNNDMAIATVEALKLNMKDSEKTLLAYLIENDKVDKDKAIAADLMEEAPVLTAALKTAVALGNTVVEVTFDAEINEGAADTSLYSIEGLEINDAVVTGEKTVRLETSAQTAGTKYTLVVGDVKVNFGGKAKVSGAPELKKVTGPDTELVELVFNKTLDFATSTDVANYEIKDVEIEKAELDGDTVTLTTKGLKPNKTHTVKVTGVKSIDGVALKSASKSFYSKSDKTAPKVDSAKADTFKRVKVYFNEELDKESAENVDNYEIAGLTIEKADLVEYEDEDKLVELTTSAQKSGTYTLKVKGVKDASVLGNEIVKEQTVRFSGKTEDKAGPTVPGKVTVLNRNRMLVEFNDNSRLDFTTVEDIANYEIDKDITVEKAEMLPGYDADTKEVILTVSDMAEKTIYTLNITGVADEYGNEMKKTEKRFNYTNVDLAAAKIDKVVAVSDTKVEVYFDKHIDPVTAKDVANYTINGGIDTPISAKANSKLKVVTLKVNELTEGKSYKLTINGLMDLAGNTLKTNSTFVARTLENDITAPEIQDISVVNRKVMRITFDESIDNTTGVQAEIYDDEGTKIVLDLNAVYDNNTVLEFSKLNFAFKDIEYDLRSLVGVRDKAGNVTKVEVVDGKGINFWGNTYEPDNIDFSWEQVNVEKYKFIFSEKVKPISSGYEDDDADDLGADTVWYFTKKVAIDKVAWEGDINSKFKSNHLDGDDYKINNTEEAKDNITTITAYMEDTDVPYIENVEAVYRNEVKVTFNEDLKAAGAYEISYYDLSGRLKKYNFSGLELSLDDNEVTIKLGTKLALESRFDYTLKVTTQAQDLAGNKSEKDEVYDFQGTDLAKPANYITGVNFINGSTVEVKSYDKVTATVNTDSLEDKVASVFGINVKSVENVEGKGKTFKFDLDKDVFKSGVKYIAKLGSLEYEFEGIVEDGITVVEEVYEPEDENGDVIAGMVGKTLFTFTYDGAVETDTVVVRDAAGNIVLDPSLVWLTEKVKDSAGVEHDVYTGEFTITLDGNEPKVEVVVFRGDVPLYFFERK